MKLFIVTVTRTAMVWAESENVAANQSGEIQQWEEPEVEATEADGRRAHGWTDDELVYHDSEGDITLAEAEAMLSAEPQPDTQTVDMFAEPQAA
jgi:hypothetical protein